MASVSTISVSNDFLVFSVLIKFFIFLSLYRLKGGVFIVIFIGVVLACITLAIEYWYFKGKRDGSKVVAIKEYGNAVRTAHNGPGPIPPHMGHAMPPMGPTMGPMAIRH